MNKISKKDWFKDWFDSPYYHLLYQNRDEKEAEVFINNLIGFLKFENKTKLLDLACGKGRHAFYLSQFDFIVYGADLATKSIEEAKNLEKENLKFFVHDMRNELLHDEFDGVFNLFTSFGYFDNQIDNKKVLDSIYNALKTNGLLVVDFMNVSKVVQNLVINEQKTCSGVTFSITRCEDGKHIYKNIEFESESGIESHTERVQQLYLNDFKSLLSSSGFNIEQTFGNYQLERFDENTSDRLIIIARKNA
jgi:SAM-dependent methyltransferase